MPGNMAWGSLRNVEGKKRIVVVYLSQNPRVGKNRKEEEDSLQRVVSGLIDQHGNLDQSSNLAQS